MTNYLKEAVEGWWGERCEETEEGCPCCEAWKMYDDVETLVSLVFELTKELDNK